MIVKIISGVFLGIVVGAIFFRCFISSREIAMKVDWERFMRKEGYINSEYKSRFGGLKNSLISVSPGLCIVGLLATSLFWGSLFMIASTIGFVVITSLMMRNAEEILEGMHERTEEYRESLIKWGIEHDLIGNNVFDLNS